MNQNYDCFNLDPERKCPSEGPLRVEEMLKGSCFTAHVNY